MLPDDEPTSDQWYFFKNWERVVLRDSFGLFIIFRRCHYYNYNHFRAPWTLSGTTRVSRYQKGKTRKVKPIWIYWHQLGHMEIRTSPQTGNQYHASIPPLKFFKDRMPFLSPNQQRESTEGKSSLLLMAAVNLVFFFSSVKHIKH